LPKKPQPAIHLIVSKRGYDIIAFATVSSATRRALRMGSGDTLQWLHLLGGILATRLELALIASAPAGNTTGRSSFNATRVFAAAKKNGVAVVVLRTGVDGLKKLADTSLPESVKAELSATLATGDVVVAPVRPVVVDRQQQFAWWCLEPTSGEVRGVMPGGRGQEMAEYAWQVASLSTCLIDCFSSEEPPQEKFEKLFGCELTAAFFAQGAPWWMYKEWWLFYDITSVFIWHAVS
jgi:hypothetical protein